MDMKAGVGGVRRGRRCARPLRESGAVGCMVAAVADHMGDQTGAIRFFEEHTADYCILGELTDNTIYLGHRGRLYWDVTSIGHVDPHVSSPRRGQRDREDGAAGRRRSRRCGYTPELPGWVAELFGPELFTAVGRIYGGLPPGGPSMIPDECTIRVDSRPQPGIEVERGARSCSKAASRARWRSDPEASYEVVLADREDSAPDRARPSLDESPSPTGSRWSPGRSRHTAAARGSPTPRASGTLRPHRDLRPWP